MLPYFWHTGNIHNGGTDSIPGGGSNEPKDPLPAENKTYTED